MPRIRVDFIKIQVDDDGDNWPNGEGEIYYEFRVDNDVVASRPSTNPVGVDSGNSTPINASYTIIRDDDQHFSVYGSVSEADELLSGGPDHAGSFVHTYTQSTNWGQGPKSVRLQGDGLDVTVHYKISLA